MTTYSPAQIAQLAANAGFSGPGLVRAVAVALAESDGDPAATHTNTDGSIDRGLWQFNSKWHPEVSAQEAFSPTAAAAAAYRVSNGGKSWSQWATWGDGRAAAQMGRATLAAAAVQKGTVVMPALDVTSLPGDILGGIASGAKDILGGAADTASAAVSAAGSLAKIGEAVVKGAAWLANPHNWLRVLEVTAGAGVVIIGVKMLADSGVGGPVGAAARGATKAGGMYVKHLKKGKAIGEALATGGESAAAKGAQGAAKAAQASKTTAAAAAKTTTKAAVKTATKTTAKAAAKTTAAAAKGATSA